MSEMVLLLLGVALGVPASVSAAVVYDLGKNILTKRNMKVELEGTWAEFVKASQGRQFSLGKIYFDKKRRIWLFDGTNFKNNGDPFCHWQTVASHLDIQSREYFYMFRAIMEGQLDQVYHGFGVLHLAPNAKGRLSPVSGYYVSATIDGTGMSHSVLACDQLRYGDDKVGPSLIKFVREANRAQR